MRLEVRTYIDDIQKIKNEDITSQLRLVKRWVSEERSDLLHDVAIYWNLESGKWKSITTNALLNILNSL